MMMPSTMILTILYFKVLKRNRGLSLDIGSRYERAEHKTHNSNRYVGLAGSVLGREVEADPPDKNFQSPVGG